MKTHAYVGGNATLDAPTILIEATTPIQDTFDIQAISGVGDADEVALAGSLSVGNMKGSNTALLRRGAVVNAAGGDIALSATTNRRTTVKALPFKNIGGASLGIGASIAVNVVNDETTAALEGTLGPTPGAALSNARDLTLTATTTSIAGSEASGGALGGTAITPVAATTISNVTTTALIGAGPSLSVAGAIVETAIQNATATATAIGDAIGTLTAAIGPSIGLVISNHNVVAQTLRDLTTPGAVSIAASGLSGTSSDAKASAAGALDDTDDVSGQTVNAKIDDQLALANDSAATNAAPGSGVANTPVASSPDGGGAPLSVAASIAVTIAAVSVLAAVGAGVTLTSGGGIVTLSSKANADSSAKGDATAKSGTATNVGAAVAINRTTIDNSALVGTNSLIHAHGLSVSASVLDNGGDQQHDLIADATSGAGDGDLGVAGSFAMTIANVMSNALVLSNAGRGPPGHDLDGGSASLTATSAVASTVTATSQDAVTLDTGIGASIAINIVSGSERAELANGAGLSDTATLSLVADGDHTTTTTAVSGAAGGTAAAFGVALAIPSGATEAIIGTGSLITLGSLVLTATRTTDTSTTADGVAPATSAAAGVLFAITVADETARVTIARPITTGSATIASLIDAGSDTSAFSSSPGAPVGSTPAEDVIDDWIDDAKAKGWLASDFDAIPSAVTPDGPVGVAAAIAVNVAMPHAETRLLSGANLVVPVALTLSATSLYDADALANATATNTNSLDVAVAIAVDVALPSAEATVAGATSAPLITIVASVAGETDAVAISSVDDSEVGVALAIAVNVADASSRAAVEAGGNATATGAGGDVLVHAVATTDDAALSSSAAQGEIGTGVIPSFSVNVALNGATAAVDGTVVAPDDVTVLADGHYTARALALGGAAGGATLAPVFAIEVTDTDTLALVGSTGNLTVGDDLLVHATYAKDTNSHSLGTAVGLFVALGASISFNLGLDTGRASLGGHATVTGTTTVLADMDVVSSATSDSGARGIADDDEDVKSSLLAIALYVQTSEWATEDIGLPVAQLPNGAFAIAAAVAANVELAEALASIAASGAVSSGAGILVRAASDVDASADADARIVDGLTGGLGLAAAVAINVAGPTTEAVIAGAATSSSIADRRTDGRRPRPHLRVDGAFRRRTHGDRPGRRVRDQRRLRDDRGTHRRRCGAHPSRERRPDGLRELRDEQHRRRPSRPSRPIR